MKLSINGNYAVVSLSRRNLLALLHKLDNEPGQRMLSKVDPEAQSVLIVTAQNDEEHYGGGPAGAMAPETETFIAEAAL